MKTPIILFSILAMASAFVVSGAVAQSSSDTFSDREDGAKLHVSGFVCPARIGPFERDAVGEADPEKSSDFCAYGARDGVYGTITLTPLAGPYDPRQALAPKFREQEAIGGKRLYETTLKWNGLGIYTRAYRTSRAEALEYRILFTGAALKNWVVEVTVEYGDPRDAQTEAEFLHAVYQNAQSQIGAP